MQIYPHHQAAINNLVKEYENDQRFLALIIGGSVAKGCARKDSDVDFMMVVTDEEFQQRKANNDFFINRTDLTDYEGGYVDGKIIDMDYLYDVAEKGNDPTRVAFDSVFVAFSHVEGLQELLKRITVYPEAEREERMKTFYCMAFIQNWLMNEASRHDNLYTKTRASSQLVLFASRLILAYNRVLFPYHKWMLFYVEKCEQKPEKFLNHIQELLEKPSSTTANTLFESLKSFRDWGVSDLEAYTWFMKDVEWSWRNDTTPLEDI
jgi:predicted nucleotidyltransferase